MKVYFIGAGPGAPDLITLRAKAIIERAPVILYAGSLIPDETLAIADKNSEIYNTASMDLESITSKIETAAANGQDVARLHSGDPSLYSAMAEQIAALRALDIDYEIVPGVPAFAAAAAELGRELTLPALNQTIILTRTPGRASTMPASESLEILGASKATLAIHLSAKNTDAIIRDLTPHYGADCPVVVAVNVSKPDQQMIETTLENLTAEVKTHDIERSAIIFVGRSLNAEAGIESALYSKDHVRYLKPGRG